MTKYKLQLSGGFKKFATLHKKDELYVCFIKKFLLLLRILAYIGFFIHITEKDIFERNPELRMLWQEIIKLYVCVDVGYPVLKM